MLYPFMLGSCNSGLSAANGRSRMAERLANSGLGSKWQNVFIASSHFPRGTKGNKKTHTQECPVSGQT